MHLLPPLDPLEKKNNALNKCVLVQMSKSLIRLGRYDTENVQVFFFLLSNLLRNYFLVAYKTLFHLYLSNELFPLK